MLAQMTLDAPRTRAIRTLFGGVALGTTALFATVTVGPLAAEELTGSATWSGLPVAATILGTAAGAAGLSGIMARRGRRPGLVTGYAVGAAGGAAAVAALVVGSLALLFAGMILIGVGNASNQLARYAAADLAPTHHRASLLGFVVWAGTVGALLGPNLISPTGSLAVLSGLPRLTGALAAALVAYALAAAIGMIRLRPDPRTLAYGEEPAPPSATGTSAANAIVPALIALVTGQGIMVFIMTMTPIHLRHTGGGLGTIGLVASLHVVGMYAFAPLLGRLGDRVGLVPVIVAGHLTLAAAGITAALSAERAGILLAAPLLLLGLGWSASFVAGSTLLTRGLPYARLARVQGMADTVIWSTATAASLASGIVLTAIGYTALCLVGASLVVFPLTVIGLRRRTLTTAPA